MLAAERQRRILELARKHGNVRTADLARDFDVTEETIRRDLDSLSRRGHLLRTHGGAMDPNVPFAEPSHTERQARQSAEKSAIAGEALRFVTPGETILLDASSTVLELASRLPADFSLRVVTYSLAVVERLAARDDLELIQLGGVYEPRGRRFSGMLTESAAISLRVDRFFFSGGGLDPVRGISEPNPEQARLKRLMVDHAEWNCALLDHSKFGIRSDFFFATPDRIDAVVTDRGTRSFATKHLKKAPYELRFAR